MTAMSLILRRKKAMNNNNNGLLVILSGPSGSGKDTILTELTKRDMNIKVSTSMTTRKKRVGG